MLQIVCQNNAKAMIYDLFIDKEKVNKYKCTNSQLVFKIILLTVIKLRHVFLMPHTYTGKHPR
jgi:hypothetical protein